MSVISPASISKLRVGLIAEVTRGTTPSTPAYQLVPIRDLGFESTKNFAASAVIRSDRQPASSVGGVTGAQGTIPSILATEVGLRTLWESALNGAWAQVTPPTLSVSFVAASSKISRASGSWLTIALATRLDLGDLVAVIGSANNQSTITEPATAGDTTLTLASTAMFNSDGGYAYFTANTQWIKYTGKTVSTLTGVTWGIAQSTAANEADNAVIVPGHSVTAITAADVTFGTETVVDEAAVSCTFVTTSKLLLPGSTRKFFSIEQGMTDVAKYETYKGQEVNTVAVNIPTSGECTCDFGLIGTDSALGAVAGATYTATGGELPMSGSASNSNLLFNGAAFTSCIESLAFNLNNDLSPVNGVGSSVACAIAQGTVDGTISFNVYYVDETLQDYFKDETRFALTATAASVDGDRIRFTWPRLVFTQLPKTRSGSVIAEAAQARMEYDMTTGYSLWLRQQLYA